MEKQLQFANPMGETLAGTLHQPARPPVGAVIAGHCFTCSRHTSVLRYVCSSLCEAGFAALRFDFSGNGQSEGSFERSTWSKQILEMEAAIKLMQSKGFTWIGLAGHSLGAAIALLAAQRIGNIAAVCRIAGKIGATGPRQFLTSAQRQILAQNGRTEFSSRGRQLTIDQEFFDDARRHDLIAATRSMRIPMLVVHGDRDAIIPVAEAQRAHEVNPQQVELCIIEGGDHMFARTQHRQKVVEAVTSWFCRQAGVPVPE
jgi:uncharacterized protein